MVRLTQDWIYLGGGDRKALSLLLGSDFTNIVMVPRKRLIAWLATADRVSRDSSLSVASTFDRLIDEADKAGITAQ